MKKYLLITLFSTLLLACSTTENLPEGEQLYVGLKKITYNDDVKKKKKEKTGVITAVADAVKTVENVLDGSVAPTDAVTDLLVKHDADSIKRETVGDQMTVVVPEVESVLGYAPNGSLFGSSSVTHPFKFGLWAYNKFVNSPSKFGKWMFKVFATDPVLVSTVAPEMRSRVAATTLRNYGFFRAKVSSEVLTQKNPKKAKIAYDVQAGPLFTFNDIAYRDFEPFADSLLAKTKHECLLKPGKAFSAMSLSNERTRIESLMRENGYFYYSAGSTLFEADTVNHPGMVDLRVFPDPIRSAKVRHPWYIGRTFVMLRSNDGQDTWMFELARRRRGQKADTASVKMPFMRNSRMKLSDKPEPLRRGLWYRSVSHRKGDLYRLSDQNYTLEKLSELGVLAQYDVSYMPADTTETCDTLNLIVSAQMDKLYDSAFEVNAMFKSNQQLGPGVSYELAKRNPFRGAEKVAWKIFGSYEWQLSGRHSGNKWLNSFELGTQLSFSFPRFVFPFISRKYLRFPAKTEFALGVDWRNRSGYFNMLTWNLSAHYQWHKKPNAIHDLTLLDIEYDHTFRTTETFDSIMAANPSLAVSMRDQFVPSLTYSFTWTSPSTVRNPLWLQFTAKEAGNILAGGYAAFGKSWNERDKKLFDSPFAQFVKLTAEAHHNWKINNRLTLATRAFIGAIFTYGNSQWAPYSDQFYVGGANSVRGFTVRTIGPGSYRSDDSKYSYIDQTGDFKLELNAELRARLFGSLFGAVFLDAGNVWLLRDDPYRPDGKLTSKTIKNIAFGTGIGIRYDLDFLVLRLDWGIGLHAPYKTSKSGFYNLEKFKDGTAIHFAIGYPF